MAKKKASRKKAARKQPVKKAAKKVAKKAASTAKTAAQRSKPALRKAAAKRVVPKQAAPQAKKAAAREAVSPLLYQIKVALEGSQPPIWRRLLVPDTTLDGLHRVLQAAFGWDDDHLYCFEHDGQCWAPATFARSEGYQRTDRTRLGRLVEAGYKKLNYVYDFGDNWQVSLRVEKTVANTAAARVARCADGANAPPPDSCGGIWQYYHLLELLGQPDHPDYELAESRLGDDFDPERFDPAAINRRLAGE